MPECKKCGKVSATAEMRKSRKGGYLCVDKSACARREQAQRLARKGTNA